MDAATELGTLIGEQGRSLVYGGGSSGLMGRVSDAVIKAGGEVTGIIPTHLKQREIMHEHITELIEVPDMHTRKLGMMERADGFVVMPGGMGTLEEFFEILTWKQLQLHDKPIVICNLDGYWDNLLETINGIIDNRFAKATDKDHFTVVDEVEKVIPALQAARDPEREAATSLM
ncbi:MAG: TIGR00730 family Rossman fold protein [Alphaproteobacteria bacterium]